MIGIWMTQLLLLMPTGQNYWCDDYPVMWLWCSEMGMHTIFQDIELKYWYDSHRGLFIYRHEFF